MYAVILSGGKQYKVKEGDVIKLESMPAEVGASIDFNSILLVGEGDGKVQLGKPFIEGSSVSATVLSQGRSKKIHIIKFKRRKHHEKWQGHRQNFTEVQINKINS